MSIFFDNINSITSKENAENVVKDPKNPIIRKYLTNSSEKDFKYPIEIK